jgi:hypothetical protein
MSRFIVIIIFIAQRANLKHTASEIPKSDFFHKEKQIFEKSTFGVKILIRGGSSPF